jgi:tRNA G10  N-methylase Trm11
MPLYAFILGRKPLLSIAEICQTKADTDKIVDIGRESLILERPETFKNPQDTLNRLGGTVKIAEIFAELKGNKAEISAAVSDYLLKKFQDRINKVSYGISAYSFAQRHESFLKEVLKKVKKELTAAGLKNRFINHNFKNVENAAIKGEGLLTKGAEIVIIQGKDGYFLGETKALQDFEYYSHRDYNRPARDPRLGMLPPKLAQMMINFSGFSTLEGHSAKKPTVYDPFVGIGTVLSEGFLLGYDLMGSDLDPENIKKAQQNLDWLIQQKSEAAWPFVHLFSQDATRLGKKDLPRPVDLIVTESYLGPPVSQFPSRENIAKTFGNIRETIFGFFKTVKPLLRPSTPIVISLLFYRDKNRFHFIEDLLPKIVGLGYEVRPLLPKELKNRFNLGTSQKESLLYDRPDQVVGREIWKLVRK